MMSKTIWFVLLIFGISVFAGISFFLVTLLFGGNEEVQEAPTTVGMRVSGEGYNPFINPAEFSTQITNKYLTFIPGITNVYEVKTEEGKERTEVHVTSSTRMVMGVRVIEVRDRVWLDDKLIEDTLDWYAQDKEGNVWYFGEESKDVVDGKVVSTKGSWVAGVDGAKPGIVMKAAPRVGDRYQQEYDKGVAEDMGEVIALGVRVKTVYGAFSDCIQTKEWNPLESGDEEYKYYCAEVGGVVYERDIKDGEEMQLVEITKENSSNKTEREETPIKKEEKTTEELKNDITEQEAAAIAQTKIKGKVTDIDVESKFGKPAWVVEIEPDDGGPETDVIIDITTGEVLGIET